MPATVPQERASAPGFEPGRALAEELIALCRERLASLRDRYWAGHNTRVV